MRFATVLFGLSQDLVNSRLSGGVRSVSSVESDSLSAEPLSMLQPLAAPPRSASALSFQDLDDEAPLATADALSGSQAATPSDAQRMQIRTNTAPHSFPQHASSVSVSVVSSPEAKLLSLQSNDPRVLAFPAVAQALDALLCKKVFSVADFSGDVMALLVSLCKHSPDDAAQLLNLIAAIGFEDFQKWQRIILQRSGASSRQATFLRLTLQYRLNSWPKRKDDVAYFLKRLPTLTVQAREQILALLKDGTCDFGDFGCLQLIGINSLSDKPDALMKFFHGFRNAVIDKSATAFSGRFVVLFVV